jgi:putative glutamine amidotransferase
MKPRIAISLELSIKGKRRLNFLELGYAEGVEEAGGVPFYFPPIPSPGMIEEAISMVDGLVLTGGADIHPSYYGEEILAPISLSPRQRTDFDLAIFRAAMQRGKAILAICLGMQVVNVALGGTLIQDIPTQSPGSLLHRGEEESAPARHEVRVEPGSSLADILGGRIQFEVSSTHHQAVRDLGKDLQINARAPDGLVEGIELPGYPRLVAVQWHPERDPGSNPSRRLFRWLVEMASSLSPASFGT